MATSAMATGALEMGINTTLRTLLSSISSQNITPFATSTTPLQDQQTKNTSVSALTRMHIILYILMAFVGAVGNALTIAVLLKPKFRKRKSSILLLNLAICDVLIAAMCIPLDVVYFINGKWIYGKGLCYVISPFQTSMPIVSSWTFMFMMLERNSLFTKSLRRQMKRKSVRILAISTWIVPVALVIPYSVRLQFSSKKGIQSCSEEWDSEVGRKLYTVILSVFEFLIPMLIIIAFVIRICINLSLQSKKLRNNSLGLNKEKRKSRLRQNRNITMMFIVMVALYAILKLPNNIFWQWNEFGGSKDTQKKHLIWTFVSLAAYSTSMVNPIVVAVMSSEFRKEFYIILRCRIFTSIETVCLAFRRAGSDSRASTEIESSHASLNHPYKIVRIEMRDLVTTSEAQAFKELRLVSKPKKNHLVDTDTSLFQNIGDE